MPDNPMVWIIAILALAIVVIVALWKGQMVEVDVNPLRLRFKRHGGASDAPGISVGAGMSIDHSTTGDIVGVKAQGPTLPPGAEGHVTVAQGAHIRSARTGDIAGVKQAGGSGPEGGDADSGSAAS